MVAVIERALGDAINVESLINPNAARERLNEGGVDILLTDLQMPRVDGRDLLCWAKRRNPSTQVLLLANAFSHDEVLHALQMGAIDYLLKPVDQKELVELIAQAHQRRQQQELASEWQTSMALEVR
jgi:two-component system response regulator YesN